MNIHGEAIGKVRRNVNFPKIRSFRLELPRLLCLFFGKSFWYILKEKKPSGENVQIFYSDKIFQHFLLLTIEESVLLSELIHSHLLK